MNQVLTYVSCLKNPIFVFFALIRARRAIEPHLLVEYFSTCFQNQYPLFTLAR